MNEILIKEIASKVNKKVNIPFLSERTEQKLFESIVRAVLEVLDDTILAKLGVK